MLHQIDELSKKRRDFAFETTLSGKTYLHALKKLKAKGYTIHLYFLWLPDVKIALKRIVERVKQGGHDIPRHIVQRRFKQGIVNLFSLYKPLLDFWTIVDNSMFPPSVIALQREGELNVYRQELYEKIKGEAQRNDP